jgi:polar amino acid transport system substrate-binding protein
MRWRCFCVGLLLIAPAPAAAADSNTLTVLFHVRPPYSGYGDAQQVAGLLIDPVNAALERLGMRANWIETPPARQTEEIKRAAGAVCALGWFKRPEREEFATFTLPIYHDQPAVIVTRKDDARFVDGMALYDAFRDPTRTLVVKTGYSYGATIDTWLKEATPHAETSAEANDALLNMIALKRGDYLIMAPEEAGYLLETRPALGDALRMVKLSDAPAGELRYLMCAKATPPALIERINGKLPALPSP